MTENLHNLVERDKKYIWHPFTQAQTAPDPIPVERGEGVILHTTDGRRIVDYISSWWVNLYGHAHPQISTAIAEQAARLEQVIFAGFTHRPAVDLAQKLAELLPGDLSRVFYSDNGSTAVEVALKIAWQYCINRAQTRRTRFLTLEKAYHGDTVGAMAAGVSSRMFEAWKDLLFHVDVLPWPATWEQDEERLEKESRVLNALDDHLDRYGDQTCAVIMEPLVQGAGGMRMVRPAFVATVVERVRQRGILVIFDEVMTGFGRTGRNFACEKIGVVPDLICLSKGLTAGFLPLSVTVAREDIYAAFLGETFDQAFCHGHSFTANPLGCAAALASVTLLQTAEIQDSFGRIERAHQRGLDYLRDLKQTTAHRVCGTIAACDAVVDDGGYGSSLGHDLKRWFWARGLLIRPLGNVVYQLPPYIITDEQIDQGWKATAEAMVALNSGSGNSGARR